MSAAVERARTGVGAGPGAPGARVCLGAITAPHGLCGEVRIRCFTADPHAIAAYGPLCDGDGGRRFELEITGALKGGVRARIRGCTDRDQAEALRGVLLCVDRSALPPAPADEFYHADLEGLRVEHAGGGTVGTVASVHDFGGGAVLEIRRPGGPTLLVPFTREGVPEVDLARGRIVIDEALLAGDAVG